MHPGFVRSWVGARRASLLARGGTGPLGELAGPPWSGSRGYFGPHVGHTGYPARSAGGRTIGIGLVEGACKPVVGRRRKQTGARWKVRRVERMATLCAVRAGAQWDAYWAGRA